MADKKQWSNLKNQSPKKADELDETKTADESEAKAEDEAEEEIVETKEEKKARIAEEKAKAKAEKEAKAEADSEDDSEPVELSDKIYFVHSDKKFNLNTNVGTFHEGLFVANTEAEAECIRKTEDFQWGLLKEYSEKEYKKAFQTKKVEDEE